MLFVSHVIHNLDPDKNSDPNANEQFQAVGKAYKILGDPKLRSTYDFLGAQGREFCIISVVQCVYSLFI